MYKDHNFKGLQTHTGMKRSLSILFLFLLGCNAQQQSSAPAEKLYTYDVEESLSGLGIALSELGELPPGVNIERATQTGNLVYLSGNGPTLPNGERISGKVGADLSIEQGYEAARITAINHLSVLKAQIGDLNKVVRVVKVLGMVNADPAFTEHPRVINGYTDLMIEVFGDRGRHARSAVGMSSLPWNMACEVEAIIEVQE